MKALKWSGFQKAKIRAKIGKSGKISAPAVFKFSRPTRTNPPHQPTSRIPLKGTFSHLFREKPLKGRVAKTVVRGHVVFEDKVESTLSGLSDAELRSLVHEYPEEIQRDYADLFKEFDNLESPQYKKGYRRDHPELVDAHIRGIKGIVANPGSGQFVPRQSIQVLDRVLKF